MKDRAEEIAAKLDEADLLSSTAIMKAGRGKEIIDKLEASEPGVTKDFEELTRLTRQAAAALIREALAEQEAREKRLRDALKLLNPCGVCPQQGYKHKPGPTCSEAACTHRAVWVKALAESGEEGG